MKGRHRSLSDLFSKFAGRGRPGGGKLYQGLLTALNFSSPLPGVREPPRAPRNICSRAKSRGKGRSEMSKAETPLPEIWLMDLC
jgi:hypothetical protein